MSKMIEQAIWAYWAGGLSLVPINAHTKRPYAKILPQAVDLDGNLLFYKKERDGTLAVTTEKTKLPKGAWEPYQKRQPTKDEIQRWIDCSIDAIAVVGGLVSGGVEIIDFDVPGYYDQWAVLVDGLVELLPRQRTGGGGIQIAYRCPMPQTNQKLAWHPDGTQHSGRIIAIETRGEHGYALLPPSLHPSGHRYELLNGKFSQIPTITQKQRDFLLDTARQLCQAPKTRQDIERGEAVRKTSTREYTGESVIDAYNAAHDIRSTLRQYHYTELSGDRWSRPGKEASGGVYLVNGNNKSYHYSSNDPLDSDSHGLHQPRSPFDFYLEFEHNGDYTNAVRMAAKALGMDRPKQMAVSNNGTSHRQNEADHNPVYANKSSNGDVIKRTYAKLVEQSKADAIRNYDESFVVDCLFNAEEGDARLLDNLLKGSVVYDHAEGLWYWYNNLYWEPDKTWNIYQLTSDVLSEIYKHLSVMKHAQSIDLEKKLIANEDARQEDRDKLKSILAISKAAKTRSLALNEIKEVKQVLTFATAGLRLGITGNEWDSLLWILPCVNAIVDLKTGDTIAPEPTQYIRSVVPTKWLGIDALCARFELALNEFFPNNPGKINYIWKLLGYALTGTTAEHIFPILFGAKGRNGKDTLLDAVQFVLGSGFADAVSNDLVLETKGQKAAGAATPHLISLRGKRIAWASEPSEGARITSSLVKMVTGGGRINARRPHDKDEVSFKPTHTLLLLTNYAPHAPTDDSALWERVKLIDFTERFVDEPEPSDPHEHPKDPQLKEKLQAEASGILSFLVRGCLEYQKAGLIPPDCIKMATGGYRDKEDTLRIFFDDCCVIRTEVSAKASTLYSAYKDWCVQQNLHAMSGTAFGEKIKSRFTSERKTTGMMYLGIGILQDNPA